MEEARQQQALPRARGLRAAPGAPGQGDSRTARRTRSRFNTRFPKRSRRSGTGRSPDPSGRSGSFPSTDFGIRPLPARPSLLGERTRGAKSEVCPPDPAPAPAYLEAPSDRPGRRGPRGHAWLCPAATAAAAAAAAPLRPSQRLRPLGGGCAGWSPCAGSAAAAEKVKAGPRTPPDPGLNSGVFKEPPRLPPPPSQPASERRASRRAGGRAAGLGASGGRRSHRRGPAGAAPGRRPHRDPRPAKGAGRGRLGPREQGGASAARPSEQDRPRSAGSPDRPVEGTCARESRLGRRRREPGARGRSATRWVSGTGRGRRRGGEAALCGPVRFSLRPAFLCQGFPFGPRWS